MIRTYKIDQTVPHLLLSMCLGYPTLTVADKVKHQFFFLTSGHKCLKQDPTITKKKKTPTKQKLKHNPLKQTTKKPNTNNNKQKTKPKQTQTKKTHPNR